VQDVTNVSKYENNPHRFSKEAGEELDGVKIQAAQNLTAVNYSL
jgi:hypothetical protein